MFYGTLLQRLDRLFLPNFIKNCVRRQLLDRSSRRLAKADKSAPPSRAASSFVLHTYILIRAGRCEASVPCAAD